jgi:hypothetical protein
MNKMEEKSLSMSGSVMILNEETTSNESDVAEPIIADTLPEMSADVVFLQIQHRVSSPSISIQRKFNFNQLWNLMLWLTLYTCNKGMCLY